EVRPCDEPHRIIDLEPSTAIDDRRVQREHPPDIAFGAPVEVSYVFARSGVGESRAAEGDAGDGERCEDQRLMLPGEPGIPPGDRCDTKRGGGKPNTDHRRYGNLDHPEDSA